MQKQDTPTQNLPRQQKQPQMTTNYQSQIVNNHELNQDNHKIENYETVQIIKASNIQGQLQLQHQFKQSYEHYDSYQEENQHQEYQNYQHLNQFPETENYHETQGGYHQNYQNKQQQQHFEQQQLHEQQQRSNQNQNFDQFNNVEPEINSLTKQPNFQEKPTFSQRIQQKPIAITQVRRQSQKIVQQQPIKDVDNSSASNNIPESQAQKLQQKPVLQSKQEKGQKKKKKKKKVQQGQPLPIISAESAQGKKQIDSLKKISESGGSSNNNAETGNNQKGNAQQQNKKIIPEQQMNKEQPVQNIPSIKQVSQIIDPSSVCASTIIFQAQRQRIGSTLDYFLRYLSKHQKHTANQKQLIRNVEQEIEKKRASKQLLCSAIREYFDTYVKMSKDFYQKSYKFVKNEVVVNPNPLTNMKQQLKVGIDQLIFLRKSVGNEYNRMGDFIQNNIQKNISKLFNDYWATVAGVQAKHNEKIIEFQKKQKQFGKRVAKVQKVYTRGKQGVVQDEDLFIQMTKFINQQKQYRRCLTQYGLNLIPLKKAFIKAEQALYQQLQIIFNHFKNQCRILFSIHPKQFNQIEKFEKLVKKNNTFQKLSDITDGDYVRSVLITLEKASIQDLTDKQFQKVLNMIHFEEVVGNSYDLLRGTTSKTFELKNKTEQVVDTVSGNLLIFNKQTAEMKQKFIIKNINAKIVQDGMVQIDQVIKGIIFDSNRTVRVAFRDNDRAEELICFLIQAHEAIKSVQNANKS